MRDCRESWLGKEDEKLMPAKGLDKIQTKLKRTRVGRVFVGSVPTLGRCGVSDNSMTDRITNSCVSICSDK